MTATTEPVIDGEAGAIPGMAFDWLFTGSWFGITCWDCSGGRQEITEERQQLWHVISFLHDGAFVLHSQGRSEVVDPTSVLLYNPSAPYQSSHPFGCCDHGSALVIRRESLLDVMLHHDPTAEERPDALFTLPLGKGLSRAYMLHRMMVRALQGPEPSDPLALESMVLRILREVAGSLGKSSSLTTPRDPARTRRDYVADTKTLLQRRFREKLRLNDIGRALHVSTYHLCRIFKEETGEPIHRYLNRLRLRHALDTLATTGQADLSELAFSLGFADHSHLSNSFRKEFGVSPRQVRELGRGGVLSKMMKSLERA
ncbi:MAG TPA: AraC family transcriptional regulator [Thermoanaerobaculia bacterium]|nr:AraC family transcriptional regulator [Thermoanaerobaculia bacterium]